MWIFTPSGFLSIVDKSSKPGCLVVRARDKAHISAIFPKAKVRHTPEVDYQYRADVPRAQVADVIRAQVMGIDYSNFKNRIRCNRFHDVCSRIWSVCTSLGKTQPYSGARSRSGSLFGDDDAYSFDR